MWHESDLSGGWADTNDECIHGLGPVAACTICNGRDKREKADMDRIAYHFVAKFDGHCGKCGAPTLAGEDIAATVGGQYVCDGCAGEY